MNNIVAAVCAAVLVIALQSEKCVSLETNDNVKSEEEISKINPEDFIKFLPIRHKANDEKESLNNIDGASKRFVRQAYQGQTQIYPNLPSGPPYGLQPYPNNNNQNNRPGYNNPPSPYGQNPQPYNGQYNGQSNYNNPYGTNNDSKPGYPNSNGYRPGATYNNNQPGYPNYNGYKPSGTNNYTQPGYPNYSGYKPSNTSNNPSGTYGQGPYGNYPQNPQPNSNNPYGANTQPGSTSNGYRPSNSSYNPTGPYGQSTPPNSWKNPYSSNNGPSTNNNPSGIPPYRQPTPSYNNSYSGYPSYSTTPKPYPGYPVQRPTYYPGQSPTNNSTRPGNQHSVVYDGSTKRPGQNPYNNINVSNWSGNTLNNTHGQSPYNSQNGQYPQYPNSYPGSPGYGQQNTTSPYNNYNQRPPHQNPHYGQAHPNSYPGHSSDSATFNLANSGYNPSIPVRPPYGSPYGNGPYGNIPPNQFQYPNGTTYDPTRVSPQRFNSY